MESVNLLRTLPTLLMAVWFAPMQGMAQTGLFVSNQTLYVSPGSLLYVTGDLENGADGVLENEGEIQLQASFINSSNIVETSGRWVFNHPSDDQWIQAPATQFTLGRLVLDKAAGSLTLNADLMVRDSLILRNGLFNTTLSETSLTIKQNTGLNVSVAPPANSYVLGPIVLETDENANGDLLLPIGDITSYRPVRLLNISTASNPGGPFPPRRDKFAVNQATPAGSAGNGVKDLLDNYLVEILEYAPQSDWSLTAKIDLTYVGADNLAAIASNEAQVRIASANAINGVYNSLGNAGTNLMTLTEGRIASCDLIVLTDGDQFFRLATNGPYGSIVALNGLDRDTVFEGDTNLVILDPWAMGFMWQTSTDSTTWLDGMTTPDSLFTGRLFNDLFVRAVYPRSGCVGDTSAAVRIIVNPIPKIQLTAMLEGPYHPAGDSMYALMMDATGPRIDTLFEHGGAGYVTMWAGYSTPSNAVDVVLVEVRDIDKTTVIDSAYAWLLSDGQLVDFFTGDDDFLRFRIAQAGIPYYYVLKHRNHLSIMTNTTEELALSTPALIDLTNLSNVYLQGAKLIGTRALMYTGNADLQFGPNDVNAMDYFRVFIDNIGLEGYHNTDVTLDGYVNAADLDRTSRNNDNLVFSTVP